MKNQRKWVENQLKTTGEVSRNGALSQFISRLGAIVCNLNKSGWEIKGEYRKTEHGKDFIYFLISAPKVRKSVIINNIAQEIYV